MAESSGVQLPDTVEAIEYFYEQGMTDGLPVVPPTQETVGAFLEAGGVEAGEVLGTRASRNWVVTAQKVAVNAVMAGCKAEYAPVVNAAVRALMKPEFNASAIAEDGWDVGAANPDQRACSEGTGRERGVEPVRARVEG